MADNWTKEGAKERHPAGKLYVPKVEILQQLSTLIDEHQWLYGATASDMPTRRERWDVRSLMDYAIMRQAAGVGRPGNVKAIPAADAIAAVSRMTFAMFYHRREVCMQTLYEAHNIKLVGAQRDYILNYGDWRLFETSPSTTCMKLIKLVQEAIVMVRDKPSGRVKK